MKVAVLAEPWHIPPQYYGGAERMCHLLCDGLVNNGHQVNLLSAKSSNGYHGRSLGYRLPSSSFIDRAWCRLDFSAKSLNLAFSADIIYSFRFWPEYLAAVNRLRSPVIFCQQNAAKSDDLKRVLRSNPKRGFMQGVSKDQLSAVHGADTNRVFMIYNSVDTDLISPVEKPACAYLAYLGRLNYDKGVDVAVKISRITGIPLRIAGVIRPHEPDAQLLFEKSVKPFLGEQIKFIGPIDDYNKTEFLGNALALLMPNRWREPFGITMAESLAAGTPIIGTSVGSIPELVDNGKTGFVCNSLQEMCDAVFNLHTIDRAMCRDVAVARFSQGVYIKSVLEMFNNCLSLVA